jgi:hypothetical protein
LFKSNDPAAHIQYAGGDQIGVLWGSETSVTSSDTTSVSDGEWHHIAAVFNQNVLTFYKDGVPASETLTMSAGTISGPVVLIGARTGGANSFNGEMMDAASHHVLLYHVNVDVAGDRDAGVTRAPWASSSVP